MVAQRGTRSRACGPVTITQPTSRWQESAGEYRYWELGFLVQADDGLWRLPPGTRGQLPLPFSLQARQAGRRIAAKPAAG